MATKKELDDQVASLTMYAMCIGGIGVILLILSGIAFFFWDWWKYTAILGGILFVVNILITKKRLALENQL